MLRAALERADERQRLGGVDASGRSDVHERHASGGHRAGLVQHDRVHAPCRFEDLGALDEDPELCATTGADEERRGRREPERARARDDQDGDRGREGERRPAVDEQPEGERRDGEREHDRHEDGGDPVCEPLHGSLARLRLRDEPRDLRERRLASDARRPHDEPAAEVDRGARDVVPRTDLDRCALAGQQRPVDGRAALDDHAVGRDPLPGTDDERRPDGELLDRHLALDPVVAEHARLLRPELEEGAQSGAGAALRARLEISPGENEASSQRLQPRSRARSPRCRGRARARSPSPLPARPRRGRAGRRPTSPRRRASRSRSACPSWPFGAAGSTTPSGGTANRPRSTTGVASTRLAHCQDVEPERRNHGEERAPGARGRPRRAGDAAAAAADRRRPPAARSRPPAGGARRDTRQQRPPPRGRRARRGRDRTRPTPARWRS